MTFLKRRVGRKSKTVGKRMPVEENKFTKEELFFVSFCSPHGCVTGLSIAGQNK
jgi:hypothetical protein